MVPRSSSSGPADGADGREPSGSRLPSTLTATSMSLLERLRCNDAEGWRRLTHLYGSLVYSWCRRQGLKAEDASDIVQEVFRAVTLGLHALRLDRPGDSFRKWLKTIANNKIRDLWRRQQREPQAAGGTEAQLVLAQQPEAIAPEAEDPTEINHVLRQAMELVRAEFEPDTWQAFWQTVVLDRATPDVAADLGLSANAVRIAKSRIRSRLRQEFGGLLE
jgi:RNA polymerase sigma-70 factor (ECF subfamily)